MDEIEKEKEVFETRKANFEKYFIRNYIMNKLQKYMKIKIMI
jgi:hypothetical protein